MDREYARRAEDVVWRRNKLGLRMAASDVEALEVWMHARLLARGAEIAE
jgi:glycerol-3-phosphate dehydrogenase